MSRLQSSKQQFDLYSSFLIDWSLLLNQIIAQAKGKLYVHGVDDIDFYEVI